jgi:hypothetical protein
MIERLYNPDARSLQVYIELTVISRVIMAAESKVILMLVLNRYPYINKRLIKICQIEFKNNVEVIQGLIMFHHYDYQRA